MRILSILAGFCLLAITAMASAQDYSYHAYVDSDANPGTGCSVVYPGGTVTGAERRVTAQVTGTNVTTVTLSDCAGASFGAAANIGGGYPVGLNLGVSASDVIEFAATRAQLGADRTANVRLALVGVAAGGASDVLQTTTGVAGGPAILLGLPLSIPVLSGIGLVLMALGLLWVGAARAKRMRLLGLGALLVAGSAWAANFVMDGAIGDWSGVSPRAVDAVGDASLPDDGADVRQFFAEFENGTIFFRADVVDLENQRPVAASQAQTYLEDAPAQTITLAATDGDGDPLTFAIVTPPTKGVLGAITPINATSASVTYTPSLNANGADSFTFSANDGQSTSLPATVSITLTPVNDVPSFTAGANVTVLKDAGPQTISPWATALSAGPADESAQTLSFNITNNSNAALFSTAPAVSPTGVLTFTSALNANGTATITLNIMDNGGTANGGIDTSATQTFTITLTAVNDAPSFTAGPNQTVLEDAGPQTVNPWATAISAGPPDEAGQTLTFNITNNTNAALFSAVPAVSATGALTYTPAANANGTATITLNLMDNGGTANGGIDTSATQTFTITVTVVNDAPSFTAGANVTVLKDTGPQTISPWATALSTGPADESAQTLAFNITANSNAALFSTAPAVSPTGVLTFTGAANANGTATITLNAMDNGGTANGGVDTSATQTFTITLTAVNDAPSFTVGPNQTVLEDAAAQTVNPWATAISAGPADEAGQTLTFNITNNTNAALFSVGPAVSATGVLTYTPAANANGTATITLNLMDNGGTANGGIDTSATQTFTITVTAVNDTPSFAAGPNQTINEDAAAQTVNPWATAISRGPADESAQTVTFNITANTNAALFSAGPAVSPTGVLTYTPAVNTSGIATITLNVMDSGGTANGGVDTSVTQTFTITVNDVNDVPSFTAGPNQSVNEDSAAQTVNPWATALSAGPPNEAGQTLTFNITGNSNAALFSAGPAVSPTGVLTYTPAANAFGVATITLNIMDNGGTANGGIDTSATQTFTITIAAINDVPSFTVGPNQAVAQNSGAQTVNPWATAISAGPVNEAAQTLSFNITANTNAALFSAGPAVSPAGVLTFTPALNASGNATITLNIMDNGGTANGGVDTSATQNFVISVDSPPSVTVTTPIAAAIVPNNQALSITFSENITTIIGNAVTLSCNAGPNLITGGATGTGVLTLTPTYTAPLPSGSCVLTVIAANVTDTDVIDPPNNMAADFVLNFTVDAAPTVSTITPANGATNQSNTAPVVITFSESVVAAAGAFTVGCPAAVPFTSSASPATTYTLTPTTAWTDGATCTVTVVAANISDSDAVDPPNLMVANFTSTFATDAAPTVTGGTPLTGATNVATNTTVTYTFSENVDAAAGAITLNCGGAITGVVSGTGTNTLIFTPSAALPVGTACTATAVAANISDSDLNDPPNLLAADSVRTFTTDAPPSVTTTVPTNGATAQPATGTITVNFSEAVNFSTVANAANTSFDLECPSGTPTNFTVSTASPAASVVLDPLDSAIAGQTCTLSVRAAGITDQDAGDPPDNMLADFIASFAFSGVANDDAFTVTPHLTFSTANGAAEVDANDVLGAEVITTFGFGAGVCTGTAAGAQLDAGAANGRLTINANGTFSYEPPAGQANVTRTFCYTVTGGDTANVVFTLANTELTWFVDGTAAAGGIGNQARPFQTLTAAAAVDTTNDHIFLADGSYTATITLETGERLIGDGSSGALATHTGITPVLGSVFPAFSATAPVISCGGVCITVPAAGNNFLRGFTVANSGTTGNDIGGTGFGTLTVNEVTLNGNGGALRLVTGTLTGNFIDIDVTATTGATFGMQLDAVGGTWTVTNQLNFGDTAGVQGIDIRNAPASANMTFTAGVVIAKASAGNTLQLLNNNAGATLNFGVATLSNSNGFGISVDTSPVTFTGTTGTISAINGPAINANNATFTGGATFATVTCNPCGNEGINLNNVTGALTMNGGSLSGAIGNTFDVNAAASNITYAGSITSTAAARLIDITARTGGTISLSGNLSGTGGTHTGINIANNTGGTVNLSGATKTLSTGANNAVTLATNTGSNVNFTGGALGITTTSGIGFNATGGATGISVTGTGNTIASTTGTALNVANTTIAAAGFTFQSIASNGASSGIVLNTTGAGGLTVTGTGAAGTGGTIQASTTNGVTLTSASTVSLSRMIIQTSGDDGINTTSVNGFSLLDSSVINNGNSTTDEGIQIADPAGAMVFTNVTATGNAHNNFFIDDSNNTGGNSTLAITNGSFSSNNNANGNHGGLMTIRGTATLGVSTITGATFSNNVSLGLQVTGGDTATISDLTVSGCTFSDTGTGNSQEISMDFAKAQTSNMTVKVLNNNIQGHNSHGMNFFTGAGAGTTGVFNARVENNTIGTAATVGSGSLIGNGIRVNINGDADATVLLNNNVIRQTPNGRGIEVIGRNGVGGLDVTITNNDVNPQDTSGFPLSAIFVQSNALTVGNTVRSDIRGNTVPAGGTFDVIATHIAIAETGASTSELVDTAPASANCSAQLTSTNTGSASATAGCALIAGPISTPP